MTAIGPSFDPDGPGWETGGPYAVGDVVRFCTRDRHLGLDGYGAIFRVTRKASGNIMLSINSDGRTFVRYADQVRMA